MEYHSKKCQDQSVSLERKDLECATGILRFPSGAGGAGQVLDYPSCGRAPSMARTGAESIVVSCIKKAFVG